MTIHERTITWDESDAGLTAMPTMSGLEYLEAMRDGALPGPPIAASVLMELASVERGRVVFTCAPDGSLANPIGSVHGGLMCTLLDSAAACAGQSVLDAGFGYTLIDLEVRYLRPVRANAGTLTAVGTVVKAGRRVIFAQAEIVDARGDVVATATSSLLVIPFGG